jgi:hypothetical protein
MRWRRPSAASSTKSMPSNNICRSCGSIITQEKRNIPQDSGTGAPTSIANTVPANKNDGPQLFALGRRVAAVAREFPAKLTLLSGSRMPAFTVPTNKNKAEVSRHRIPYSPARTYRTVLQMSAPSGKSPMTRRKLAYKRPANHEVSTLLGIQKGYTVLYDKIYRTLPQGLPYPATSFTVLISKEYRTHQQEILYSATKYDVPCNKSSA